MDEPSDPSRCEAFIDALKNGPQAAMNTANDYLGGKSPQELLEGGKEMIEENFKAKAEEIEAADDEQIIVDL